MQLGQLTLSLKRRKSGLSQLVVLCCLALFDESLICNHVYVWLVLIYMYICMCKMYFLSIYCMYMYIYPLCMCGCIHSQTQGYIHTAILKLEMHAKVCVCPACPSLWTQQQDECWCNKFAHVIAHDRKGRPGL